MMRGTVRKEDIDTPALLIDLDIMEKNIRTMAEYLKGKTVKLRPHVKTHKTPIISHKQIAAGAIGVTCQKLGEAEVMASAAIRDILISNQIVGDQKVKRLVSLAKHCNVIVGVDNLENVRHLSEEALRKGVKLKVAMEMNMGRCGVEMGKPAVEFAKEVVKMRGLCFEGIWGHGAGQVYNVHNFEERKRRHVAGLMRMIETRDMIEDAGIDVNIVSEGWTSTYNITAEVPGITEIQAGSYVFMDRVYKMFEGLEAFDIALTVLATVTSRPKPDLAILDAGLKAIAQEASDNYKNLIMPVVKDVEGANLFALSEEHGWVRLENPSRDLKVGDKVELIPCHCCTTCNLHDRYYGIRDGELEVIWSIPARGKMA
ncbi:MAG: DSD1 family PLP-dependent enzyme [Candidatus Bathyarchaeia archaeon]